MDELKTKQGLGRVMPLVGQLSCLVRCQVSEACHKAGYPLTHEETSAFMVLHHFDGLPQSQLAHILDKDKASVTRLMNALVKRGLVGRVQDATDRRVVRAFVTEAGKQAFIDIFPALRSISSIAFQHIPKEQIETMEQVLRQMIGNLSSQSDNTAKVS